MVQKSENRLILPAERSVAYRNWMNLLTDRFREWLPTEGPIHSAMTLGSGASKALGFLNLQDTKTTTFGEIGLPEGGNIHHPKNIVAGFTEDGKATVVFTGRTAAFEIEPAGVQTEAGHVSQMEAATAYLEILNRVGTENVILTTAAGVVNHPMRTGEPKPFERDTLPTIALIGADTSFGYEMFHMGHHGAQVGDFFPLKDSDQNLMREFILSMAEVDPRRDVPIIYYASIPALYEDRGLAHFLAKNNVQAIGMSYSPEKTFLSGATGIGRFLGVMIGTDIVELCYLKDPDREEAISIEELNYHHPQEFFIKEPANDVEVRKKAALASEVLGKTLGGMMRKI